MFFKRVCACRLLGALLLLSAGIGLGAPVARGPDDEPKVAAYTLVFTGSDDTAAQKAVSSLSEQLRANLSRGWIITHLHRRWLQDLVDTHRYDLADDLCIDAILADPAQSHDVEFFQRWRVTILLAQDKPKEALAQAKLLYNVSSMQGNEDALKLMYRCLEPLRDKETLKKFRSEQLAGSRLGPAVVTSPTLLAIDADASAYALAVASSDNRDERRAVASGNLFLLTDQPARALECFKQALRLHRGKTADVLYENIARAYKAIDGTVGRANGYAIQISKELEEEKASNGIPDGAEGAGIP
jgi:hypothetical protein